MSKDASAAYAQVFSGAYETATRLALASIEISIAGQLAAMSAVCGAGLAQSGRKTSGQSSESEKDTREPASRGQLTTQSIETVRPTAPEKALTRTSTGRSWYRAPYRSPFDPMFWLEPSAPVASAGPTWGDAVPGAYHPAFASMISMFTTPMLAGSFGQSAPASMMAPGWQPLADFYLQQGKLWWEQGAAQMQSSFSGPLVGSHANTPLAEIKAARPEEAQPAAYRSSSGHAMAQIAADTMTAMYKPVLAGFGQPLTETYSPHVTSSPVTFVDWQKDAMRFWMNPWLPKI